MHLSEVDPGIMVEILSVGGDSWIAYRDLVHIFGDKYDGSFYTSQISHKVHFLLQNGSKYGSLGELGPDGSYLEVLHPLKKSWL